MQTEEEKLLSQRQLHEAKQIASRLLENSERCAAEAEQLKGDLLQARYAETQAKKKLLEFLTTQASVAALHAASRPITRIPTSSSVLVILTKTMNKTSYIYIFLLNYFFSSLFLTCFHRRVHLWLDPTIICTISPTFNNIYDD